MPAVSRVVVSVRRNDERLARDLEIPADVPASELVRLLASALRWSVDEPLVIRVEATGHVLREPEMLEMAGVGDGSALVLAPPGAVALEPVVDPRPVRPARSSQQVASFDASAAMRLGQNRQWWPLPLALAALVLVVAAVVVWATLRPSATAAPGPPQAPSTPTPYSQTPTPLVVRLQPRE